MAHPQQLYFLHCVKVAVPQFFKGTRVLEIGAQDMNGTVRGLFTDCDYVGTDVVAGKGVDVVGAGEELDFPDKSFHVALCCEVFEHTPHWKAIFENMIRMTNGLVIFTCAATGRGEHGTTRSRALGDETPFISDYYRNLDKSDFADFPWKEHFDHEFLKQNEFPPDLYFYGLRKLPCSL